MSEISQSQYIKLQDGKIEENRKFLDACVENAILATSGAQPQSEYVYGKGRIQTFTYTFKFSLRQRLQVLIGWNLQVKCNNFLDWHQMKLTKDQK